MELQIITNQVEQTQYVLLDKNMRLVKPINDYLAYLRLRGKADNTQRAYARDLKVYFDYLENKQQEYDKVDISMIQDYVGYLRSPSAGGVFLYSDSKIFFWNGQRSTCTGECENPSIIPYIRVV
jgi:integrase/recombinase XerD